MSTFCGFQAFIRHLLLSSRSGIRFHPNELRILADPEPPKGEIRIEFNSLSCFLLSVRMGFEKNREK